MEEINRTPAATAAPATPRCTPWARCCGTARRRRSANWPAEDRHRRGAPAGLRRHRADRRHRHHPHPTTAVRRATATCQRPEGLDLARRALRPDGPARPHHALEEVKKASPTACRLPGRHARGGGQGPDHPADPHHDEPRHHRAVLRQPGNPGREPDRRGGQGLPLHPRRHERRAHPDRRRMHRRRLLVHRQGHEVRQGAQRVRPADRPEPGRAVPHREGLHVQIEAAR
jgi:hypothetical protein